MLSRLKRNKFLFFLSFLFFIVFFVWLASVYLKPSQPDTFIPIASTTKTIKVLNIAYAPSTNCANSTGKCLDTSEVGSIAPFNSNAPNTIPISSLYEYLTQSQLYLQQILSEGSAYHKYKDGGSNNYLKFTRSSKAFQYKIPRSTNKVPWSEHHNIFRPDYMQMLNRIDICDLVDNQGFSQIWLWGYNTNDLRMDHSNMAMGRQVSQYWNHSNYGDVSVGDQKNDMPICNNTYSLISFSYQYTQQDHFYPFLYHLEKTLAFMDPDLFLKQFVGKTSANQIGQWVCGNTDYPPNINSNVISDYRNEQKVYTNCENWIPGSSAGKDSISCQNWNCDRIGYYLWWMQNIPSINNHIQYNNKQLLNWWDVVFDIDSTLQKHGKNLTYSGLNYEDELHADLDLSNCINILDFVVFKDNFQAGRKGISTEYIDSQGFPMGDYDHNEIVDIRDFIDFKDFYKAEKIDARCVLN